MAGAGTVRFPGRRINDDGKTREMVIACSDPGKSHIATSKIPSASVNISSTGYNYYPLGQMPSLSQPNFASAISTTPSSSECKACRYMLGTSKMRDNSIPSSSIFCFFPSRAVQADGKSMQNTSSFHHRAKSTKYGHRQLFSCKYNSFFRCAGRGGVLHGRSRRLRKCLSLLSRNISSG